MSTCLICGAMLAFGQKKGARQNMKKKLYPIFDVAVIREIQGMGPLPQSTQSVSFKCVKCKHKTSGIYKSKEDTVAKCPMCQSLLFYCPACRQTVSGEEILHVTICHNCEEEYVTRETLSYLTKRDQTAKEIVLSGIRATGELHLGNLLGALDQFVQYENDGNLCLYFIADWHTLTTCDKFEAITPNTIAIATDYIASGLTPGKSIIYAQSSVPEIVELALYLAMFQSKNQIEDLPTLKDVIRDKKVITMGHLFYPVLMAADILGTKATVVPVGSDQIPNVELAIRLAQKFNARFGNVFTIPRVGVKTIKVPSLTGGKMGKSDSESTISLRDTTEVIEKKYLTLGVTDPNRKMRSDPGNPEICSSIYPVFKILLENQPDALAVIENECRAGTRGCRDCKIELSKLVNAKIAPCRERRAELANKEEYVRDVLHYGGLLVREIVRPVVEQVREKLGIVSVK